MCGGSPWFVAFHARRHPQDSSPARGAPVYGMGGRASEFHRIARVLENANPERATDRMRATYGW
jgi:hypothetical protein